MRCTVPPPPQRGVMDSMEVLCDHLPNPTTAGRICRQQVEKMLPLAISFLSSTVVRLIAPPHTYCASAASLAASQLSVSCSGPTAGVHLPGPLWRPISRGPDPVAGQPPPGQPPPGQPPGQPSGRHQDSGAERHTLANGTTQNPVLTHWQHTRVPTHCTAVPAHCTALQ